MKLEGTSCEAAFFVFKDMTQLITPNLDPYIYINGVPLNDWCGWCLGYVASAFQLFGANSAHEGWVNTQFKHQDQNFPQGVYIPIWFDWYGNIDGTGVKNWGHVAIYKDGKVWSSPIAHKPSADEYGSLDALLQAFGGQLRYVGWSEDLNGSKVVALEGGEDMITAEDINELRIAHTEIGGWDYAEVHAGKDDQALITAWQGKDWRELVLAQWQSGEGFRNSRNAEMAAYPDLVKQTADLRTQVDDLTHKVNVVQASNGDATKWQTLKVLLKELLS